MCYSTIYYDQTLDRALTTYFYRKRLGHILLPYVVISTVYFIASLEMNDSFGLPLTEHLSNFVYKLLTGSAYTHLYFIFISAQFYILFPFILKLLQSSRFVARWAIPLGFALQWMFIFLNKYALNVPNKGSYVISYAGYYMVGAYVALHFDKIAGWLNVSWRRMNANYKKWTFLLWGCWLIAMIVHVTMWYYGSHDGIWVNALWYELLWNVHTMLSALVLLQLSFLLYDQARPKLLTSRFCSVWGNFHLRFISFIR